jgi:hypothetical protein
LDDLPPRSRGVIRCVAGHFIVRVAASDGTFSQTLDFAELAAVVDANNGVAETNESNNAATTDSCKP